MSESKLRSFGKFLISDVQTFSFVAYLMLIITGMIFKFMKFNAFGINIFHYADIFDFLIAPFEDFLIILYTLVALAIPTGIVWWDEVTMKYPKKYGRFGFVWGKGKPLSSRTKSILFLLFYITYMYASAANYAEYSLKQVQQQSPITLIYEDDQYVKGKMIGKTKEIIFLQIGEEIRIFPFVNFVKEIKY